LFALFCALHRNKPSIGNKQVTFKAGFAETEVANRQAARSTSGGPAAFPLTTKALCWIARFVSIIYIVLPPCWPKHALSFLSVSWPQLSYTEKSKRPALARLDIVAFTSPWRRIRAYMGVHVILLWYSR
jgi:hypothetical protein